MPNIKEFLEDKSTFKKVLEILNQKGDVTNNIKETNKLGLGFIAGGSVSNILYSMIHGGEAVINDIDVYNQVNINNNGVRHEWYANINVGDDSLEMVTDDYGRVFVSENGSKMRVVNHSRTGIFNNMEYIYEVGRKKINPSENLFVNQNRNLTILNGFDLNCCKSGLDLDNSKIIYTDDFVEFLRTKELKVVNPCAPIQSCIRVVKKIKDLGCFCNVEHQMRYLTVASKHINSNQMVKYIGIETYSKYLKHKEFVDKYFKIREPQNIGEIPQSLKQTFYIGNHRNPDVNIWLFEPIITFDVIDNINSVNTFKRLWELLYTTKKKSNQDKINKIYYKNVVMGDMTEDQWENKKWLGRFDGVNDWEVEPFYNPNRFTVQMLLTKKDYYKCDFDFKHVDYIDKFTNEHHLIRTLIMSCKTIIEQYRIVKFIKELANKEGDWIIGILENIPYDVIFRHREHINKETITKLIEDEKTKHTKNLVDKLDLSGFEYNECVKELTTSMDLKNEGTKMGHCVGGYSHSLEMGRSRIFHIDCDGIGSTLEVHIPRVRKNNKLWLYEDAQESDKNVKIVEVYQPEGLKNECFVTYEDGNGEKMRIYEVTYNINQHHGRYPEKGNLTPTDLNKNIAKDLVKYLNENCLPKNYKLNLANKVDSGIFV